MKNGRKSFIQSLVDGSSKVAVVVQATVEISARSCTSGIHPNAVNEARLAVHTSRQFSTTTPHHPPVDLPPLNGERPWAPAQEP